MNTRSNKSPNFSTTLYIPVRVAVVANTTFKKVSAGRMVSFSSFSIPFPM